LIFWTYPPPTKPSLCLQTGLNSWFLTWIVNHCCLRIDKPFAGLNTPRKQPVIVVHGLPEAAPTRLRLSTVSVRVVEVACLVEATHAYARVHLVLAENARVVEVAEFVMFSKVLLIGTARQRTQVVEACVIDGAALVASFSPQKLTVQAVFKA